MNEQQTVVFSLPANLYAPGAPVVLESGRLLKDLQTSQIFLELTMRNIQPKTIRAVKVHLTPYDAFHHPLGNAFSYQYLDFRAVRGVLIGRQEKPPAGSRP